MIEQVKDILQDQYCMDTGDRLELMEKKANMKIMLIGVPANGLKIDVPAGGKAHSGMVRDKRGYNQSCDKLILIPSNNAIDVYLIELKTTFYVKGNGAPRDKKPCEQILRTIPLWDYISSMVEIHFEEKRSANLHLVIIAKRASAKLGKQTVKSGETISTEHQGKEFQVIYSAKNIPFKSLR